MLKVQRFCIPKITLAIKGINEMNEKVLFFTLAEAARLVEINARKLAAELEDVDPVKAFRFRVKKKSREVLYSLKDFWPQESKLYYYGDEIKKMFILVNDTNSADTVYAFTITEASRLTEKSRSWILKLIQQGKIARFEGRRRKDAHKKKSLVSANALRILGLDFKPDDVFKLFTLKE